MKDAYKKIKWPTGQFTHTDLATFNGKTNGQVWSLYDQAGKDGTIKLVGERKNGKGRGSKVWELADQNDGTAGFVPAPVVVPVTPAVVTQPKQKKQKIQPAAVVPAVVPPAAAPVAPAAGGETIVEPVVELTPVTPAVAPEPVVEVVEVKPKTEAPKIENLRPVTVAAVCSNVEKTEYKCPICGGEILSVASGHGIRVWCPQTDTVKCTANESPFGFGKNAAAAYDILCQKYGPK
jgi:hypothetical protein